MVSARPTVTPLAEDRYQIRFTASAETYQKLRQAQELLGHSVPSGDVAAVVDRALSALIADLARKKLAATDRPRTGSETTRRSERRASSGSRHIPAEVRRSVWQRDGGRCAFVATDGRRCSARKPLEFHHVHPYAAGGEATVGNIELRCRSHNAYEAELFYGANRHDDRLGIVRRPDNRHEIVREPAGVSGPSPAPHAGTWQVKGTNSPRGELARIQTE
jgi:5-methylcytosine-specific restriction endonuclease McrA